MSTPAPLSVVIPTFRRLGRLLETLARLRGCDPAPAEILVHVDTGDDETAPALRLHAPDIRLLESAAPQGPGGARNRLIAEAKHDVVVSLDDDSYPIDGDFFAAVLAAFEAQPEAGVLAMSIIHDYEPVTDRSEAVQEVADFVGCGCAYRRAAFLETDGYLPLHPAYGMEEADLALQLIDRGWKIVHCPDLRVRHATDRAHQTAPAIVAAHVRNTALLAFLRYPLPLAPRGLAQFANRIAYSTRRGHVGGALRGIAQTPGTLLRHRAHRHAVQAETVRTIRRLRRGALLSPVAE